LSQQLNQSDEHKLVQLLLDLHHDDPVRLRRNLPEIARELDRIFSPSQQQRSGRNPFGLTDRERTFYKDSLEPLLRKSKSHILSKEEAVKGLEHAAALLIDNYSPGYPPRQDLLRLVRKASGIVPRKTGKQEEKILRDGTPTRTVPVVMGVDLHLTEDLKLISVTLDPQRWRRRAKALSFVGIGRDQASDVAERHDDYLADAIQHG